MYYVALVNMSLDLTWEVLVIVQFHRGAHRSSCFQLLNCLKPSQAMANVLAEWLSKHDIKQAHIAGQSYAISVLCRAYLFSCI